MNTTQITESQTISLATLEAERRAQLERREYAEKVAAYWLSAEGDCPRYRAACQRSVAASERLEEINAAIASRYGVRA